MSENTYIEEVYLCAAHLRLKNLTWKSPRTLTWIKKRGEQLGKTYTSAHDLTASDFKALYKALTQNP